MPLFDINTALSCELPAAYELATLLSETTAVKNLAETTVAADALEKIKVGISSDPFDGETFKKEELEARLLLINVYAEPEDGFIAGQSPEARGTPRQGGAFCVAIKRQVRESEQPDDAYNFFWDRVSAIGSSVMLAGDDKTTKTYRFKQMRRTIGPEFGARRAKADQGDHLVALLVFTWGDVEQE